MTKSASSTSGAVETLLRDALSFWRDGLWLSAAIAIGLSVRWLHIASHVYESRATLELSGSGGLQEQLPRLRSAVDTAFPVADKSVILRGLPGGGLALFCRADAAELAREHCAAAVNAVQRGGSARVVQEASLPSRPLPAAPDAAQVVIVTSILIGMLGGASWTLVRVLIAHRPTTQRAGERGAPRSNPPRPTHRVSYAPAAARVVMASSAAEARATEGSSDTPDVSPGAALAKIVAADTGSVLAMPVPTTWMMDPDLLRLDSATDLARLRDELCVAATSGCFVVGVTSMPEGAHLKSRLAAQLAWLLAQTEHARVLLIEVDFAHPNVDAVMRIDVPPMSGFSQQLHSNILEGNQSPWVVVRCTESLCVLAEGKLRTPGVIYSNEFTVALAQLRNHFDLIVADGPAIGPHVDTRALDDVADGIVLVTPTDTPAEQALKVASQWFRSSRLLAAASVLERRVG
jgi:Mrp family chromosome partitioning ATPase